MNVNKFGWKCAQRRPLRALAHTLLLFDPSFAAILDDDTYLNYPHLIDTFGSYLFNDMIKEPIYMGEFLGKTGVNGHLSTEGIFAGGAGYLLGQRLLQILHNKQIKYFGFELNGQEATKRDLSDRYRSDQQIRYLSLLHEGLQTVCNGMEVSKIVIKGNDSKVPFISDASLDQQQMYIPIPIRLIEFCTNLMANEHACHHSDHSFGRCMLYGAFATPIGSSCHSTGTKASVIANHIKIGLCFMTPVCDIHEQVTCHRYRATLTSPSVNEGNQQQKILLPIRNTHIKGYFRMYSSIFDGNSSDSYA